MNKEELMKIKCYEYLRGDNFGITLTEKQIEEAYIRAKKSIKPVCFICGCTPPHHTLKRYLDKGNICDACNAMCNKKSPSYNPTI